MDYGIGHCIRLSPLADAGGHRHLGGARTLAGADGRGLYGVRDLRGLDPLGEFGNAELRLSTRLRIRTRKAGLERWTPFFGQ